MVSQKLNAKHEFYELQRSELTSDKSLIFEQSDGFSKALTDGFFHVKIPTGINLTAGDRFARNFYKEKEATLDNQFNSYRGFYIYTPDKFDAPHEGYYLRDLDQTEQFFLEKKYWSKIYPKDLVDLAIQLDVFAINILKNVMGFVGIPETIWDKATGNCIQGMGTHHLTFNHFRPEINARGLNVHKDSGWVTVLRSISPGLEAYIDNQWRSILPVDGYFIVNFGCAMEILTAKLNRPVSAVIHRVVKQSKNSEGQEDRYSYALFTDNSLDEGICSGLYEYSFDDGLKLKMSFKKFLDEILRATYDKETVGLY